MAKNALAMSDDAFANLGIPELDDSQLDQEESTEAEVEESTIENEEVETAEKENEDGLQNEETETTEEVTEPEESEEVEESKETEESEESTEEEKVDYEALYKEVLKPFKANGREMSVDSIEDVRQLMQMGANYNKKMAALKPNLKVIKMLENNGLLDESKLSYLIDVSKHNPDAIKKLVAESGLDPLDIDINEQVGYKANTYTVNDKELELDTVLSDIRETDSFNTTINIIGNKWDDSSKKVLLENPNIIKVINEHVGNGIYDQITREVERLKILGRLDGLSDIDAYKAVGDVMYAPKANALKGKDINTSASKATNTVDPKLKDRKKAASPTKGTVTRKEVDFNPLSLSDAEFEKLASSKFI